MAASWIDHDTGWVGTDAAWSAGATEVVEERVQATPQGATAGVIPGTATAGSMAAGFSEGLRPELSTGAVASLCQSVALTARIPLSLMRPRAVGTVTAKGQSGLLQGTMQTGDSRTVGTTRVAVSGIAAAAQPGQVMAGAGLREVLRLASPLTTTLCLTSLADTASKPPSGQNDAAFLGVFLTSSINTTLQLSSPLEIEQTSSEAGTT